MKVVGHRGWAARFPENALEGVWAALDAGAAGVEVDLRVSADGAGFLMHDDDTARTTGRAGELAQLPASAVRDRRLANGEPVPTLIELLRILPAKAVLLLELKPQASGLVTVALEAANEQLNAFAARGELVIMSFDNAVNAAARSALPGGTSIWRLSADVAEVRASLEDGTPPDPASAWSVSHRLDLGEADWRQLASRQQFGAVWTVNPPERADFWRRRGARFLITDDPGAYLGEE